MPCPRHMTLHPVPVYRHGADLSMCYLLVWNVTLEYTATYFNVLGETRPGNPSPTFLIPANAQLDAVMVVISRKLGRKYRTNRVLNPGHVVCESITLSARLQRLLYASWYLFHASIQLSCILCAIDGVLFSVLVGPDYN